MAKRFIAVIALVFIMLSAASSALADNSGDGRNLASGLEYTVVSGEKITFSYGNYAEDSQSFDNNKGQLTDSETALTDAKSDGWYRAFRGGSRIVQFDLGSECAVWEIKAGFLNSKVSGIYAPRYIRVRLSDDGENWQKVWDASTNFPLISDGTVRCDADILLPHTYKARYVSIEYTCDIFSYCDEISVIGADEPDKNAKSLVPDAEDAPEGYLLSLDGVKDIIKIYNGYYPSSPDLSLNTEAELIPYIAYVGADGSILDTMFDAVALVPCHGDYPSGGRLVKTSNKAGAVMSDWELYYDYTFGEGRDLENLDSAVGTVYSALGKSNKFKVYLTLPFPTIIEKAFGDIDGDGKDEYCRTLAERSAILEWYAKKCIAGFKSAGYSNLELAGFYWYREEVNYSESEDEEALVKSINSFVRGKKLSTLFDPFYLSTGYDEWEELGFSGAVMQPNVAFRSDRSYFSTEMLEEFASAVYNRHLGVEIETDEPSYFRGDEYLEAGFNYESYLYYGWKTGYMNSLKTYYQGAGPGTFYILCNADTSTPKGVYLRRLYDLTYSFIKGSYKNEAPTVEISDFEVVSGDRRVTADINITDNDSYWGDVTVTFPTQPSHGSVAVSSNKKTLIYSADRDFSGIDSFTVKVSDGFSQSAEITVSVTVAAQEKSEPTSDESSTASESGSTGSPKWLPVVIASAAVIAAAGIALIIILRRRKK